MPRKSTTPDLDACLEYHELVALTIVKIPDQRVKEIAAHLFVCRRCSRKLFQVHDTLGQKRIDRLRADPKTAGTIVTILRELHEALTG